MCIKRTLLLNMHDSCRPNERFESKSRKSDRIACTAHRFRNHLLRQIGTLRTKRGFSEHLIPNRSNAPSQTCILANFDECFERNEHFEAKISIFAKRRASQQLLKNKLLLRVRMLRTKRAFLDSQVSKGPYDVHQTHVFVKYTRFLQAKRAF